MGSHPSSTTSIVDFESLGVPRRLVGVLNSQGLTNPFPIQAATLPDSLSGRDVLGRGRTGSGKTLAFVLPLLARMSNTPGARLAKRPRALVLVPTRELATQVHAALAPLAQSVGLSAMTIFGGVSQRPQVSILNRGVDIVIACPGRLEDLGRQGHVQLDDVAFTVIDEADHMADLGFLPAVRRILNATDPTGQRLLFSATLDNGVDVLVRRYLHNPVSHSVDDDAGAGLDIAHHVLTVAPGEKAAVVAELAAGRTRSVLFTRTKHSASRLARDLTQSGVPAVDLHGNLSQAARDRNLASFRSGEVLVLVATDVAARGIHVDDVAMVVHVDPPAEHKAYTHRSGRTARAGASGIVVTLQTAAQRSEVATLTRRAGIVPTVTAVVPGAKEIRSLTGPRAPHVAPSVTVIRPATPERGRPRVGRTSGATTERDSRGSAGRRPSEPRRGSSRSNATGRTAPTRKMSPADFSASRRSR